MPKLRPRQSGTCHHEGWDGPKVQCHKHTVATVKSRRWSSRRYQNSMFECCHHLGQPLQSLLVVLIGTYLSAGPRFQTLQRWPTSRQTQSCKTKVNIRVSKTSHFRVAEYPSLMRNDSYHGCRGRCYNPGGFDLPVPFSRSGVRAAGLCYC